MSQQSPLTYRLITGVDDRSFCERITAALAEGYILHGGPAVTFNGENVIAAQAVVLPGTGTSTTATPTTAS
ncbi:MAG: DUF1737 domain-containing protein [Acidobacteria bacterium]|nr:DUF1737 domain-containing protein [Acidobacteriota bacterium]